MFQFKNDKEIPDYWKDVEHVVFPLSYYENHIWKLKVSDLHNMKHKNLKTQKEAIKIVEEWFSKPLTDEFFEMVKDDTNWYQKNWEEIESSHKCRGDLLGDKIYLSEIRHDSDTSTLYLEFDI